MLKRRGHNHVGTGFPERRKLLIGDAGISDQVPEIMLFHGGEGALANFEASAKM